MRFSRLPIFDESERGSMLQNRRRNNGNFEVWGWLLFVGSALFFIVSSTRTGDTVGLLGVIFFLLGGGVFLAGYVHPGKKARGR